MKLEAINPSSFDGILRVATVLKVNDAPEVDVLHLHFDGGKENKSYFREDFNSRWLFPAGFASHAGIPFEAPIKAKSRFWL